MHQSRQSVRNGEIDFWRVPMALLIVLYHCYIYRPAEYGMLPFDGGYLAVEFFFIVTGYFAVEKVCANEKASYRDALKWSMKMAKSIIIYAVPLAITWILLTAWIYHQTLRVILTRIVYSFFETFLLKAWGFGEPTYFFFGHVWYVSAICFELLLFYPALLKRREQFLYTICPLSVVAIYGYSSYVMGWVGDNEFWTGICYWFLPRTWAGLCLGGGNMVVDAKAAPYAAPKPLWGNLACYSEILDDRCRYRIYVF